MQKIGRIMAICLAVLMLCGSAAALAADVCYPTAVQCVEDGGEIRKIYDLSPEDDPAGIPRSDFVKDGYHYTLAELLKQELPERECCEHTETVSVTSKSKDMESMLALLPAEREVITEDGFVGTLTLKLDTVNVEAGSCGSSTKELAATRTYPGLASQDTSVIPKSVEDSGNTLALQKVDWQVTMADGVERFTAVATYTGSRTDSYVKDYIVTADYVGEVERIVLNKVRYVAVFEDEALDTPAPEPTPSTEPDMAEKPASSLNIGVVLVPIVFIVIIGSGIGIALLMQRRKEGRR